MNTSPHSEQNKYEYWDHPAFQIIRFYDSAFDIHCLPPTMFIRHLWCQYTSTTQKKHTKANPLHVSHVLHHTHWISSALLTHTWLITFTFLLEGQVEQKTQTQCFKRCCSHVCEAQIGTLCCSLCTTDAEKLCIDAPRKNFQRKFMITYC